MQENTIHIGGIICERLKTEGRKKVWLANKVNCDPSGLCKILQKPSLDTDLLLRISIALHHNFFEDFTPFYNKGEITPQFG